MALGLYRQDGKLVITAIFRHLVLPRRIGGGATGQNGPRRAAPRPTGRTTASSRATAIVDAAAGFVIAPGAEYAGDFSEVCCRLDLSSGPLHDHTGKTMISFPTTTPRPHPQPGLAEVSSATVPAMHRGYNRPAGKARPRADQLTGCPAGGTLLARAGAHGSILALQPPTRPTNLIRVRR